MIDKEMVTTDNVKFNKERDLLKVKVKEQQEETITVKREKLQHETDTMKNFKVDTKF